MEKTVCRTVGTAEVRTDERTGERERGRTEGRKNGKTEGCQEGRKEGKAEGCQEGRKEERKKGKKFDRKRESLRCTFSKYGRIQNKPHPINKARDFKDTVVARYRTGDGQGSALAFVTVKRVGPD